MAFREFVTPNEIVKGVEKLNLAFVANMFNKHPALEAGDDLGIQETREEKSKQFSLVQLELDLFLVLTIRNSHVIIT